MASLWQQSGRAGRGNDHTREWLALFVAQSCVADEFLLRNHAALLADPLESSQSTVI